MKIVGFTKDREIDIDVNKKLAEYGIAFVILSNTHSISYAETNVSESLRPLLRVLQDLAEPISYGFMIKGFMQIMSGDEHQGYKTIKLAISGFVGIQWIPYIYKIIKTVKLG